MRGAISDFSKNSRGWILVLTSRLPMKYSRSLARHSKILLRNSLTADAVILRIRYSKITPIATSRIADSIDSSVGKARKGQYDVQYHRQLRRSIRQSGGMI